MSRIAFSSLRDFFVHETTTVVVARVTDTKPQTDDQQATLEVLETLYGRSAAQITLTQNRLGGCTLEEQTNLLRRGGVYVLPLYQYEEGRYSIWGDLDVLFEIDDKSLVFSHSDRDDFKAFDGKPYTALLEAVSGLLGNEPLLAKAPRLTRLLDEGMPLVEVTVLSAPVPRPAAPDTALGGQQAFNQQARLTRTLAAGQEAAPLPEELTIVTMAGEERLLQPGDRYVLFLWEQQVDGTGRYFGLESNRAAHVGANGALTTLFPDWDAFAETKTIDTLVRLLEEAARS
jgi:hypothetical protein